MVHTLRSIPQSYVPSIGLPLLPPSWNELFITAKPKSLGANPLPRCEMNHTVYSGHYDSESRLHKLLLAVLNRLFYLIVLLIFTFSVCSAVHFHWCLRRMNFVYIYNLCGRAHESQVTVGLSGFTKGKKGIVLLNISLSIMCHSNVT